MNNEIREILDYLKNDDYSPVFADESYDDTPYKLFDESEIKILLDYITNLQQENERLKIKCDFLVGKKLAEIDKNAKQIKIKAIEQEDYKSRVEKAVEYNNRLIKDTKDFYRPTTDTIYSGDCIIDIAKNNINILQNGSDDK